jgi:hypothetical protein
MTIAEEDPILYAIPYDRKITKKELMSITGINTERGIRDLISQASKKTAIFATSNEPGYRRARPFDKCSTEELQHEIDEAQHCINETDNRKKALNMKKRAWIAYKKAAEKYIRIKESTKADTLIDHK